jgi:hypothetical protein
MVERRGPVTRSSHHPPSPAPLDRHDRSTRPARPRDRHRGPAAYPLRNFLTRNQVAFRYLDDRRQRRGDDTRPTRPRHLQHLPTPARPGVSLPDGTVLLDPSISELAERPRTTGRGQTDGVRPARRRGRPAGLAAAVYGASEGLSTAVARKPCPAAGRDEQPYRELPRLPRRHQRRRARRSREGPGATPRRGAAPHPRGREGGTTRRPVPAYHDRRRAAGRRTLLCVQQGSTGATTRRPRGRCGCSTPASTTGAAPARRPAPPARTSSWGAPATPPARPLCTSPPTRRP